MDFETETQFNRLGKRLRDEDAAGINTAEWDGHPKHRKLVFRTPSLGQSTSIFINTQNDCQAPFPHSAHPNPHTPTLTPADSSSDSSNAEIRSPPLGPSVAVPSTMFTPADDDVDMAVDGGDILVDEPNTPRQGYGYGIGSPMVSPKSQTPTRPGSRDSKQGRLAPIVLTSPTQAGDLRTRVPTPIYGHFSTHSGENTTGSPMSGQAAPGTTGSPLPHHSRSNHYNIALYPHHHLQERKMPSPISETFHSEGSTQAGSAGVRRANGTSIHPLQTGHLTINCDDDMATSPSSPTAPTASTTMARSSSTGPRRRSDAISGSPGDVGMPATEMAQQSSNPTDSLEVANGAGTDTAAGHKASFHMGFKADCKMCHDRVPGHFNHISHARV